MKDFRRALSASLGHPISPEQFDFILLFVDMMSRKRVVELAKESRGKTAQHLIQRLQKEQRKQA